jgi:single-strand DNA-binding protein
MSVNKVILVGHLGRDVETRFTSGGQSVSNFTLATDESFTDKSGSRQKRTEWHSITAWGKLAEICQKYLRKGSLVYVEGKIQSREYEARDGGKKKAFEIVISDMRMLDKKADSGSSEVEQVEVGAEEAF